MPRPMASPTVLLANDLDAHSHSQESSVPQHNLVEIGGLVNGVQMDSAPRPMAPQMGSDCTGTSTLPYQLTPLGAPPYSHATPYASDKTGLSTPPRRFSSVASPAYPVTPLEHEYGAAAPLRYPSFVATPDNQVRAFC
eukprot:scaffold48_cov311-Pinguiococcus_pyrenoidosus.AAC.51